MSALDTQVGGTHYRNGTIQPVQFIEANKLQYLEASVVKRVTRHDKVGGKGRQDIEKAIHELQLLLELRYPQTGQQIHPKVNTDNWPKVVSKCYVCGDPHGHGAMPCPRAVTTTFAQGAPQGNPNIDHAMNQCSGSNTVERILGS